MPLGPGALDSEGIYQFGESDTESLASDLLNLLAGSTSTQIAAVRAALQNEVDRLDELHAAAAISNTFSAVSALTIPAFASAGYSYRVRVRVNAASASHDLTCRLVDSGTPSSAASYDRQAIAAADTTLAGTRALGQTSWLLSVASSRPIRDLVIELEDPAHISPTSGHARVFERDALTPTGVAIVKTDLYHRASTAYNSLQLLPSAGTISGSYRVDRFRP